MASTATVGMRRVIEERLQCDGVKGRGDSEEGPLPTSPAPNSSPHRCIHFVSISSSLSLWPPDPHTHTHAHMCTAVKVCLLEPACAVAA